LFLRIIMSSLKIRPASIADVTSIIEVRLGALTEEEMVGFTVPNANLYWSDEKLKEMLDKKNRLNDGSEIFVAEVKGKVIGFIIYNMEISDDNIDNIVVAKEEQGKGIGRVLVEHVEELAKSRGFDVITTDTTENTMGVPWKAYGFWKKIGYQDAGKRLSTQYDFKVIPLVKRLR
jgi:ribosomal protein S18 acetylase RimI-like enzyme